MKNNFFMILFLVVGSLIYTPANAQSLSVETIETSVKKDGKYALLVANARHFQAAVMTGEELKTTHPDLQFEIVLIGPVVKDLATDESLTSFVETSEKLGLRIVVCEFAMKHFGITKSQYHSSIKTTPNGFTYLFGLQENDFKTITL